MDFLEEYVEHIFVTLGWTRFLRTQKAVTMKEKKKGTRDINEMKRFRFAKATTKE